VSDIFQEVEEDVRREQMEKLVRRYGPYALLAVVAFILAVGGYEFYKQRHDAAIGKAAKAYVAASLQLESDPKAAASAFAALAKEGGGYALLGRFRAAEAAAAANDVKGAVAALDAIAADGQVDPLLRDLARLKAGYMLLDIMGRADLETRLAPLAQGTSIWRFDAQALLAFSALKGGERARALSGFKGLANNDAAPPGVRRRARDMVLALEEGAPPQSKPPEVAPKPDATTNVPAPAGTTN
jgi:hypothetical protein